MRPWLLLASQRSECARRDKAEWAGQSGTVQRCAEASTQRTVRERLVSEQSVVSSRRAVVVAESS